jgi:glycosyltransferase involved in cell wall biosynthesis
MEQVLGHVTHYRTLRGVLDRAEQLDAHWVEVTYAGNGRLEHCTALPPSVRGTLRGFLQVRDGLRGRRFDALLFHTQKPAVFQWDYLARVPTVLSLDVTPAQYDRLGQYYDHTPDGDTPVARVKHWINRRTFALARQIVVWSSWVRNSLAHEYGVPENKVRVIPPGVDLDLWTAPPSRRERTGLPRVLFVGGDFARKGGSLLLDWFCAQGSGRCELDIVTRDPVPAAPGVRVHHDIVGNSPEARRLFHDADIFVLPSLGECFGIASVEAMAAGLPVVATRVGGAADIVADGETGFLIEPNSPSALSHALDTLLGAASLRAQMGARARSRVEHSFDARKNAAALIACLQLASEPRSQWRQPPRPTLRAITGPSTVTAPPESSETPIGL